MALQALKKITIRDVMKGEPEKEEREINTLDASGEVVKVKAMVAKPADLVAIYGRAVNHRTGNTQLGDYIEFVGTFEARRVKDGEVFQSTRFIAPPITTDLIEQAYFNAKRVDESAMVDFAFVIGVEPDLTPNSAKGYKYTCKPLMAGKAENDPLSELRQSLSAQFSDVLGSEIASKLGLTSEPPTGAITDASAGKKGKTPENA